MTSYARAGIEGHEPKGLRRRRLNHLPRIDPQVIAELGHLVYQPDVDRAKRVFEQLGGFCHAGARHLMHALDNRLVKRGGHLGRH